MKTVKWFMALAAMLLGIYLYPCTVEAAGNLDVSVPTERAVYQRDNENKANINVSVSYGEDALVQAQLKQGDTELCDWTALTKSEAALYEGIIPNVAGGGWYQLCVRAVDKNTGAVLATTNVEKVGVGEVFITGGQSNSCNFGGAKTTAKQDIVSAFDVRTRKWQHCEDSQPSNSGYNTGNEGGSPWPSMGDALVEKIHVPVGFVSTGVGAAKIEELRVKHYFAIKDAITYLKPYGYRAFLLHQGEADTPGTERAKYLKSLQGLIEKTRSDAGYDLNWVIAQVSYAWGNYNDKKKMESMKETQRAACNDYNIFVGPTTDDLQGDYRRKQDNLHLSEKGLIEHGKRWADVVYDKMIRKYQVSADQTIQKGKLIFEKTEYNAGDVVAVKAVPDEGYYLKMGSLNVNGQTGAADGTSFTMHAENAVVSVQFITYQELSTQLKNEITQVAGLDMSIYEEASRQPLLKALTEAKIVADNASAEAQEIQKVTAAIISAKQNLVLKELVAPSPTPPITPAPTPTPTPAPTPTPHNTPLPTITPEPQLTPESQQKNDNSTENQSTTSVVKKLPKKGTVVVKNGLKYVITSSSQKVKTVSVKLLVKKKKTSVIIPKTIKVDGYLYKVTEIAKKAFYNSKKVKNIKICSTTLKKIGKNAFRNTSGKVKIKVPSSRLRQYKKMLKGKGLKRTAKIISL